ncbi:hypothetical protein GDO81_021360 [Engystomops pustulosus]|uniref:Uncharacterized protein n=1 Tax=Engystomops pustulosus TaxID=76066 RepID=A0AAV6ZCJ6_ENGPU|nr:hypothetical protein GDO81_021360 [Engystomops pustulosus]
MRVRGPRNVQIPLLHLKSIYDTSCQQEKEKLYVELKHILARQPGPEAAEQLQIYQQTLREKTKQLKALSSELNMYESQSHEYKYEVERLASELQNLKKKYLTQKRREQQAREKERSLADTDAAFMQQQQRSEAPRFTGGGFPLSHAPKITA